MPDVLKPDVCVIGAGSGGLTVAAFCAMLRVPVVLVEKHRMGGDCLNTGCVPSKALIAAGRRAEAIRSAAAFGIGAQDPRIDFAAVHRHVQQVIATIAPNDSVERFTALGVTVMKGEAVFTGPKTVKVGERTIEARRFVIATGSRALVPPIPGLDGVPFLTNESVFDLTTLPGHLAVLGGGPIGIEMAQAFRRLGADVTVFERGEILPKEDPEVVGLLRQRLKDEGITLHENATVTGVSGSAGAIAVTARQGEDEGSLVATHLLVAAGRRPNVEGLGLDVAGITTGPAGIVVDKGLRTSNTKVYAIGDVAGGPQFTHVAGWHGSLVAQNILFRRPIRTDRTPIPRVTYSDPEIAHVGLSEAEAAARGPIRVLRWPFHENDRAIATRDTHGHVKLVTDRKGVILGATILGTHAGDLIAPYVMAIAKGMKAADLTGLVLPYPTLSEAGKRAAGTFFQSSLTNPWVHRIIGFMRRFG